MKTDLEIAKSLFEKKLYEDTIYNCKKILSKNTNSIEILKLISKSMLAIGQLDNAKVYLTKATELYPDDYEIIKELGNYYQISRDIDTAINFYKKAISINSNYAPALTNLGNLKLQQGEKEEAISLLIKATKSDPNLQSAWINLSNAYLKLDNLQHAELACKKAIEIDSNLFISHFLLANIFIAQKKINFAEECLRETIRLKNDNIDAHVKLIQILKVLGKTEEAILALKNLINIQPNNHHFHSNLGLLFHEIGKDDEAECSILNAIKLNPEFAEAYLNLSTIQQSKKKYTQAEISARKALKLKPELAEPYINLVDLLIRQNKFKEALNLLEKSNNSRSNWDLSYKYAGCLYEIKEYDQAILKLKEAQLLSNSEHKKQISRVAIDVCINSKKEINTFSDSTLKGITSGRIILNREVEKDLIPYLYKLNTKKIENLRTKDARFGDGLCSDFNLFNNQSEIIQRLSKDICDIAKDALNTNEIYCTDSFFNIFKSGCGLSKHHHIMSNDKFFNLTSSKYSLVYYLDIGDQNGEDPGNLILYNPMETILPKNGNIILFSSKRVHSVSYKGEKNRIVIGVNFYSL